MLRIIIFTCIIDGGIVDDEGKPANNGLFYTNKKNFMTSSKFRLYSSFCFIFVMILFQNCRTYNSSQSLNLKSPIDPKLPALKSSMDNQSGTFVTPFLYGNADQFEIFDQEVDNNLCNSYGQKYGYIVLRTYYSKFGIGIGYSVVSGITLFIPNLLGMPMARPKFELQATVEILNSRKELIGKYRAAGKGKSITALYYGYGQSDSIRKARIDALNNALSEIRKQIQTDAPRLSEELKKAGTINN
jgi:hypothetical protein